MISVIVEVNSDNDIANKICDATADFSASKIKFICKDSEFGETVDIIFWDEDNGFSHFLN